MYLGTGWDGQFSHLYRVGDMIPQFTCKGFHGCEWGFPRLCVWVGWWWWWNDLGNSSASHTCS